MKRWAIAALILAASAAALAQQTEVPRAGDTEKAVEAAREAKQKRKKSTTKVISNADVKRSKGKLIELPPPKSAATPAKATGPGAIEQQDERYRRRVIAADLVKAAEQKVANLQSELESVEQRYYEENDPDYRDQTIRQKFKETKQKLAEAQGELDTAREAFKSAEDPKP